MGNPVLPSSCVTPAGTSIEVQNEWEENTHTHTHAHIDGVFLSCDHGLDLDISVLCENQSTSQSINPIRKSLIRCDKIMSVHSIPVGLPSKL